jgi:hypothetical protein
MNIEYVRTKVSPQKSIFYVKEASILMMTAGTRIVVLESSDGTVLHLVIICKTMKKLPFKSDASKRSRLCDESGRRPLRYLFTFGPYAVVAVVALLVLHADVYRTVGAVGVLMKDLAMVREVKVETKAATECSALGSMTPPAEKVILSKVSRNKLQEKRCGRRVLAHICSLV